MTEVEGIVRALSGFIVTHYYFYLFTHHVYIWFASTKIFFFSVNLVCILFIFACSNSGLFREWWLVVSKSAILVVI